jgi:hypothetical protein
MIQQQHHHHYSRWHSSSSFFFLFTPARELISRDWVVVHQHTASPWEVPPPHLNSFSSKKIFEIYFILFYFIFFQMAFGGRVIIMMSVLYIDIFIYFITHVECVCESRRSGGDWRNFFLRTPIASGIELGGRTTTTTKTKQNVKWKKNNK